MQSNQNQINLINGDCLNVLPTIPDKSIDMILCDLPYGCLNKSNPSAKWDTIIPFERLWEQYNRIIKDNGAIVLTASGMFTAKLMMSNPKLWRYNLVWKKANRVSGFLNANRQPLRNHEDICVFFKKQPTYNPQMTIGPKNHKRGAGAHKNKQSCYGKFKDLPTVITNEKYPLSVIDIDKEHPQSFHPTQKPVALMEWLIKTYTNEGEVVLDNCMGSGSAGLACVKCGRGFIGIEMKQEYFEIAKERIENAKQNLKV